MKRKLVMVLLTATLVGGMMTGCGSKATTETATEETQTEEAAETDAEEEKEADAEEETAEAEDENALEIDESTLMDSEIPEDPDETIAILLAIKDYDLRLDYMLKANDQYLNENNEEVVDKWGNGISLYMASIMDKRDIVEGEYYFGVDYDKDSPEAAVLQNDIPEDPAETVEVMNSIEDPNIKYTYYEKAGLYYSSQGQDAYDKWYDAVSPYWEEVNSVIMDAADLENMGLQETHLKLYKQELVKKPPINFYWRVASGCYIFSYF